MSKKKKIILSVIIILLIVAIIAGAIIAVLLINKNKEDDEKVSMSSKWGNTYYAYLKDATKEDDSSVLESKYGMYTGMQEAKIQFCNVENEENPEMVMTYTNNGVKRVNSYYINNDGEVALKKYGDGAELRYVYNIEDNSYKWYVRAKTENGWMYYPLDGSSEALPGGVEVSDEETTVKDEDGTELTISESETKFVEPEIQPVKTIDFSLNMKDEDLAKQMKETEKYFQDNQENKELVSEEEKENISKKVEEIKTKKEKIDKIKKAEEEAKKGIKIGKYTVKYGKYEGYADVDKTGEVIVLNQDGTCQITANWAEGGYSTKTFTYKVGKYDFSQGGPVSMEDGIAFINPDGTIAMTLVATDEKTLSSNDIMVYKFAGETEKTTNAAVDPSNSFKVGKYSLNYGKYKGSDYSEGTDRAPYEGTFVLNSDGTYTFSSTSGKSATGKYAGIEMGPVPGYSDDGCGIRFSQNGGETTTVVITKNNSFMYLGGAAAEYTYAGN